MLVSHYMMHKQIIFIFQHRYKVMGSDIRTDVTMTDRTETPREEVHIANRCFYITLEILQ